MERELLESELMVKGFYVSLYIWIWMQMVYTHNVCNITVLRVFFLNVATSNLTLTTYLLTPSTPNLALHKLDIFFSLGRLCPLQLFLRRANSCRLYFDHTYVLNVQKRSMILIHLIDHILWRTQRYIPWTSS